MPRFAANLSMLFTEVPFLDRFAAAAKAGFKGVEFLFPYAFDVDDIRARLDQLGLEVVLFNLPPGHWDKGERGITALKGREDEFAAGVDLALRYAEALGCPRVHAMAGLDPHGTDRDVYLKNLTLAADWARGEGVDMFAVFVESGGQSHRVGESQSHHASRIGRRRFGQQAGDSCAAEEVDAVYRQAVRSFGVKKKEKLADQ